MAWWTTHPRRGYRRRSPISIGPSGPAEPRGCCSSPGAGPAGSGPIPWSPCAGIAGASWSRRPVSGRGTVFTFTVNRHPYNPAVPLPYVIAIVELVEQTGLRFTTDLIDVEVDEVYIGMPVVVTFEQAGEAWVPLFRPDRSRNPDHG